MLMCHSGCRNHFQLLKVRHPFSNLEKDYSNHSMVILYSREHYQLLETLNIACMRKQDSYMENGNHYLIDASQNHAHFQATKYSACSMPECQKEGGGGEEGIG